MLSSEVGWGVGLGGVGSAQPAHGGGGPHQHRPHLPLPDTTLQDHQSSLNQITRRMWGYHDTTSIKEYSKLNFKNVN